MARRGFALQRDSAVRALRLALPLAAALGLSGCASISEKFSEAASQMPGIGLPAGAPERAAEPVAFPAVHDVPPPRNSVTLSSIEREEVEKQLVAARDEQQHSAGRKTDKDAKDVKDQKSRKAQSSRQ